MCVCVCVTLTVILMDAHILVDSLFIKTVFYFVYRSKHTRNFIKENAVL